MTTTTAPTLLPSKMTKAELHELLKANGVTVSNKLGKPDLVAEALKLRYGNGALGGVGANAVEAPAEAPEAAEKVAPSTWVMKAEWTTLSKVEAGDAISREAYVKGADGPTKPLYRVTAVDKSSTTIKLTVAGPDEAIVGSPATKLWVAKAEGTTAARVKAAKPAKAPKPVEPATKLTTEQRRVVGALVHEAVRAIRLPKDAGLNPAFVQAQLDAWLKYIPTTR